jgi:hypothetical protein
VRIYKFAPTFIANSYIHNSHKLKKDIERPEVEDIAIAVVLEEENGENVWNVFLVNLHIVPIKNVIVTSKGYGERDGETLKTSTLRHFFEEIPDLEFTRIEPIMENTFGLTNEFWVSFYIDDQIYDKQYIFLPETINTKNFTKIPLLNVEGVMIR